MVWKTFRLICIQIDLNEKLLKIVRETDPIEMAQILQDIGYTSVLFPEDNVQSYYPQEINNL